MQDKRNGLIGVSTVARVLGCSTQSVRNYERRGVIPPAQRVEEIGMRVWRREEIQALLLPPQTDERSAPAISVA